ncbi:MAG: efflux RND transporter periplasmic adaptor subunit [Candidatus Sericytochromatia bacterium]|nr:efflux RND transporter periplasmic adaptor subunit [Candidatus Sericytochromatia bacterium]
MLTLPPWVRATLILGLPLTLISMWGAGLFHRRVGPGLTPPAFAAERVGVAAATLETRSTEDALDLTGTVVAGTSAAVGSQLMARVVAVQAREGDRVEAGRVLARLDGQELEATAAAAQASQAAAVASQAQARARLALAETTLRRMRSLHADGGVTAQHLTEAEAAHREALAAVAAAGRQGEALGAGAVAAGTVRDRATVRAPFAGLVVARQAEDGMLASPGQPLFRLERGPYRLDVPVEERLVAALRPGTRVAVRLEALGRSVQATLARVVPAFDPATRTAVAQLVLPEVGGLRSGMYGRARLGVGRSERLAVPAAAVVRWYQLTNVFVIDAEGHARLRLVRLGEPVGEGREVLAGLAAGERVVLDPPPALRDGMAVEVR